LSDERNDVSLLSINLLSQILNLSSQGTHTCLGQVLLIDSLKLLASHAILLVGQLSVKERDLLVFLLDHAILVGKLPQSLIELFNLIFQTVVNLFLILEVLLQDLLDLLCSNELLGLLVEILDSIVSLLGLLVQVTVELSVLKTKLVDSLILLLKVRLKVLLLLLSVAVVTLFAGLVGLQFFIIVLELLYFFLLFAEGALDLNDFSTKVGSV